MEATRARIASDTVVVGKPRLLVGCITAGAVWFRARKMAIPVPPGLVVDESTVLCTRTPSVDRSTGVVASVADASSNSCWAMPFASAASALTWSRREEKRLPPMLMVMNAPMSPTAMLDKSTVIVTVRN